MIDILCVACPLFAGFFCLSAAIEMSVVGVSRLADELWPSDRVGGVAIIGCSLPVWVLTGTLFYLSAKAAGLVG